MRIAEIDAQPSEMNQIRDLLNQKSPGFVLDKIRQRPDLKRLKHKSMTADQFSKTFPQYNIQPVDPDQGDPEVTGGGRGYDKPGHKFEIDGKTVYVALREPIGGVGQKPGQPTITAPKSKSLTPAKLNLKNSYPNLTSLYKDILSAINTNFDGAILEILVHILENAKNKTNKPLSPELQEIMANDKIYKPINQDFGETIAPFLVGKENDTVDFPVGNEPIVDLKLPGMDLAVKSLTGSGNAFTKIKDLFDSFESTIDPKDTKTRARFGVYKIFSEKNAGQKVEDQIVYGSDYAQNPEMVELTRRTGKMKITNKQELKNALQKVIQKGNKFVTYDQFINFLKQVGGVSGKVFGLPKAASSTGPKMYALDPLEYATLTFIYMLGKGLENMVINGADKEAYAEILNKIMRQVNASAGFVKIDKAGISSIDIKPFKELKFRFDYHAYTSNPGNNRPGFAIIK